jgi:hypothetical protein
MFENVNENMHEKNDCALHFIVKFQKIYGYGERNPMSNESHSFNCFTNTGLNYWWSQEVANQWLVILLVSNSNDQNNKSETDTENICI